MNTTINTLKSCVVGYTKTNVSWTKQLFSNTNVNDSILFFGIAVLISVVLWTVWTQIFTLLLSGLMFAYKMKLILVVVAGLAAFFFLTNKKG